MAKFCAGQCRALQGLRCKSESLATTGLRLIWLAGILVMPVNRVYSKLLKVVVVERGQSCFHDIGSVGSFACRKNSASAPPHSEREESAPHQSNSSQHLSTIGFSARRREVVLAVSANFSVIFGQRKPLHIACTDTRGIFVSSNGIFRHVF